MTILVLNYCWSDLEKSIVNTGRRGVADVIRLASARSARSHLIVLLLFNNLSYISNAVKMKLFVILVFSMALGVGYSYNAQLNTIFSWKYVDFDWQPPEMKMLAINSGSYIVNASDLYDVDKTKDGRYFVTAVTRDGVPASLLTVTNKMGPGGPIVRPYPDWSWSLFMTKDKMDANCSHTIYSVYRVAIECNLLFALDCGQTWEGEQVCPPKLMIFDLSNNKLVKTVIIPEDIAKNKNGSGLLVTPIVQRPGCCKKILDEAVVYMADTDGNGLAIWKANGYNKMGTFCRLSSDTMDPTNPNFTIAGQSFTLEDGILGMTITNKELFYAPLSGDEIYMMNQSTAQSCPSSLDNSQNLTQQAISLSGQTAAMASKKQAIFFSNIPNTEIMCANVSKEMISNQTVIASDSERLQFPSGMKTKGSELLIMTNRFQRIITDTMSMNETNFRVLSINLRELCSRQICFSSCSCEHFYSDYEDDECHMHHGHNKHCPHRRPPPPPPSPHHHHHHHHHHGHRGKHYGWSHSDESRSKDDDSLSASDELIMPPDMPITKVNKPVP